MRWVKRAKLKVASQEEWIYMWKEQFKNLLGNSQVTDKPIVKIINNQLNIKLVVLTKMQNKSYWSRNTPRNMEDKEIWYLLCWYYNAVYNQNTIERWTKGCIFPYHKKDLGIANNYWGITLTSIAVKIFNALLLNHIEPEIEKILRKNQNGFWRKRSTSQILRICWIIGVHTKTMRWLSCS